VAQLTVLIAAGYAGFVSMEPFSPAVQADLGLPARLRAGLDYVAAAVGAPRNSNRFAARRIFAMNVAKIKN
jgi:hypothetical protein